MAKKRKRKFGQRPWGLLKISFIILTTIFVLFATTRIVPDTPSTAKTFDQLMTFSPEELSQLTVKEITTLIERLDLTTNQTVQLLRKAHGIDKG